VIVVEVGQPEPGVGGCAGAGGTLAKPGDLVGVGTAQPRVNAPVTLHQQQLVEIVQSQIGRREPVGLPNGAETADHPIGFGEYRG
jgi:hypothetical protein